MGWVLCFCVFGGPAKNIQYQEIDSHSLRKDVVLEKCDGKSQQFNNVLGE